MDPRVREILRKPYARVLIPEDSGLFAAEIAEFPGCVTDGISPQEAYGNLEEVAESWIESALVRGFSIPEPFALSEHSGTVSLRLPRSIHRRASEFARRDGVSLNQFLVSAIAVRVGSEEFGARALKRLDERIAQIQLSNTRNLFEHILVDDKEAVSSTWWSEPLNFASPHLMSRESLRTVRSHA